MTYIKRAAIYIWDLYQRFNLDGAPFLAATISYYTLFSIFPLLMVVTSLISYSLDIPDAKKFLLDPVYQALPGSADWIKSNVDALVRNRGSLGIISAVILLWSGTNVFGALEHALNRIFLIEEPHPFWHLRLKSLLVLMLTGLLFLFSSLITAVMPLIEEHIPGLVITPEISLFLSPVLSSLTFFLIYLLIPAPSDFLKWRMLVPGAIISGLLWEATKRGFGWYLSSVEYRNVYGPISSVVVLLFWLYISASLLLLGAEIVKKKIDDRAKSRML